MELRIHADGFALTAGLQSYARGRFAFALDRARHLIGQVSVRLADINGPKGGTDKRCKVHITLPQGRDVVVESVETDMYAAIDDAAERAGHTVLRRAERQRDHRHGPAVRPATEEA